MNDYDIINGKKYKKCNDNQIRNMITKRCILKKGKIGKTLIANKKDDNDNDICIKWLINKTKNPITNRTITEKGDIYKNLFKKCNILNEKAIKIQNFFKKKFKKLVKDNKKSPKKKEEQFINKNSCIEKVNNELIIDNKIKLIKDNKKSPKKKRKKRRTIYK